MNVSHVCTHKSLVLGWGEEQVVERQDEPKYNFIYMVLLSSCHSKSIFLVTL